VDEEIAAHLAELREAFARKGLDPAAAATAAAKKFGNRDEVADACRLIDRRFHARERRRHVLGDLRQDLSYSLRLFRRGPGFAAVAIITLALGMGATTTIFTLANWALLRPVPGVTDAENVSVFWVGRRDGRAFRPSRLSYPNLADVTPKLKTMTLGAYQGGGTIAVAGGSQTARNVPAEFVTAGYFDVLGIRMQIGRPFTAAEDRPPSPFLGAVISDRLWESMFQRRADVLQQPLDVAGVRVAILGVAAPGFHGTERLSTTDLWLPGASSPIVRHMPALRYDARDSGGYYELVARLQPGATWAQAQAEMESLRAWLRDQYPKENAAFQESAFHLMGPIGPGPFARDLLKKTVGTAAWASALLLLIACANVAGLLTIRAIARRSEFGVRKALGAGGSRLIRQQLAEGALLWLAGGAAALALVLLLLRTVNVAALLTPAAAATPVPIDWRVLAFTAGVSLAVGLLFSIAPAVRATRVEAADTLRSSVPTATRRMFVGTSLAVFQLAASLTLLVGACLLVGTLRHFASVPLGFDPQDVYVLSLRPSTVGYTEEASLRYLEQFESRLGGISGIRGVASANGAPFFGGANFFRKVRATDAAPGAAPFETRSNVLFSRAYFDTLGIPLIRGRMFTEAEFAAARRGGGRVAIVNEGLARRLFGAADPVGRTVEFPNEARDGDRIEVVGVVGSARYASLVTPPDEMIYEPAGRRTIGIRLGATVIVRTDGSAPLAEHARRAAAELNPSLPLTEVLSMHDAVGRSRRDVDLLVRVVGIVALLAAVLAGIGLYAVVAHGVAQRRREFGIRVALGASRAEVWRLVLRRTAAITAAGLCFGLAGAYAFAQILSARLVGVNPLDPVLWSLAAVALIVVAAGASLQPARTATHVDLNDTLRAL
jgi:predicted permease